MRFFQKEFINSNKGKRIVAFTILFVVLLISLILGLTLGSTFIPLGDLLKSLGNHDDPNYIILTKIRFPRVLAGLFAGIGLAISGAILQSLMQNELVSPNTIGISAGSGFMVVLVISLFGNLVSFLPLAAFVGAFLTTMLIYLLSLKCGNSRYSLVLAGIAIASLFQALMKLIFVFDANALPQSSDFMIGSLDNIQMKNLIIPMIIISISAIISFILSGRLNILGLGDKVASSLGVNVKAYTFIFVTISSLLASSVISYAGLIGFVGLIVPHISRRIIGNNHIVLLPFSAMMGSCLVIICDLLSRVVFSPYEVPCGILISILGVPFFIYLLIRRKIND